MGTARTQDGEQRPARVVFWAGSFERAGTQRFLVELLRRMDRQKFEPIVFSIRPEGALLPDIESLGVPVHEFGAWSGPLAPATLRDLSRAALFLRRERVQILSCMLGITTIFGPFVGRVAGVPIVVNNQRNLTYWFSGGVRERAYRYVNRHLVDAVLVNSGMARRELIDRFATPAGRIIDIGAGIDTGRFASAGCDEALRNRLNLSGKRVVGIVAKLSHVKNHRLFLEAACACSWAASEALNSRITSVACHPVCSRGYGGNTDSPRSRRIRAVHRAAASPCEAPDSSSRSTASSWCSSPRLISSDTLT